MNSSGGGNNDAAAGRPKPDGEHEAHFFHTSDIVRLVDEETGAVIYKDAE